MEFNDHDLNDFQTHLKAYSKKKLAEGHKKVSVKNKARTEKIIENFVVKVQDKKPLVQRLQKTETKEFFNQMMGRHKRK
jgi:hypothetical protein